MQKLQFAPHCEIHLWLSQMRWMRLQDFVPGKDTVSTRRALGGFDPELSAESVAISPDGKRMILSMCGQTSSLMIAEQVRSILQLRMRR